MRVSYERLINLGNYNNERIALEDDVQPDETPEQAYQRLRGLVYAMSGLVDPRVLKPKAGEPFPDDPYYKGGHTGNLGL
jgi:hypothetical protein